MRRREFISLIGGVAATWPLAARAQQPARPMIGFLVSGSSDSFAIFVDAFKQGMLDNGMVEDRDYLLDLRFADGDYGRFPALAAEVVQRKPAAIVVTTISAARAAQRVLARAEVHVGARPAIGAPISVDVTYHDHTDLPLVGALFPDPDLHAHAMMRVER